MSTPLEVCHCYLDAPEIQKNVYLKTYFRGREKTL